MYKRQRYDQSYVHNRDIFDNISEIVDQIFNDYLRRPGTIEPFFAQYCNGTTVTCDGLSQWGTVPLAENGYTPVSYTHLDVYKRQAISYPSLRAYKYPV